MKNVNIIFTALIVMITVNAFSAQVSGVVLLDNVSDHSGILIKFIPVSPTASLDSTFTATDGFFSLEVENGVYDIACSKAGYQSYTLPNQLLMDTMLLDTIVLSSTGVVYVSGNVSGVWTGENTYIATEDLFVEQNDSLTILPGTEIKFDGYFSFTIYGVLMVNGTSAAPVRFSSNSFTPGKGDWKGLRFMETSGTLTHTIIEYTGGEEFSAEPMVLILNSDLEVQHCSFRHSNEVGFDISGGNSTIKQSDFYDFDSWAFRIDNEDQNTIIEHNRIHDMTYGIIARAGVHIRYNQFYNTATGISCKGQAIAIFNQFYNNTRGINSYSYGNPVLQNNTFNNNGTAIQFEDNTWGPVVMNILSNNDRGVLIENLTPDFVIEYNLFYKNAENDVNNPPVGFSTIVTNNANGTPCDSYFNLFSDPGYNSLDPLDPMFLSLSATSPAIDAGNPDYLDPDGSIRDLGAIVYFPASGTGEVIEKEALVSVYPNPFSDKINLKVHSTISIGMDLRIFDLNGRCIKTIPLQKDFCGDLVWDAMDDSGHTIHPGIYFYKLGRTTGTLIRK